MKFNRRNFIFAGLGAVGFAVVGKTLQALSNETAYPNSNWESIALPAEPPRLRFVCLGDTGTGKQGQYAIARAMKDYHQQHPFDFAILTGDNIYNNGEIEKVNRVFERPYQPLLELGVQFYACLGNHDIRTDNGNAQLNYPGFNMTGRYYTFRRDLVQFFALDTNKNADWDNQLPWLENQLRSSDAPWKILFGHHPPYTSGLHWSDRRLRRRLQPLLKTYGVPLYLNGHNHNYERTHPIDGTTYLTSGAGAKTRRVGSSSWTARAFDWLSFVAIAVYSDQIILRAIDEYNHIIDQAVIPLPEQI